jgi:hypothetical protein
VNEFAVTRPNASAKLEGHPTDHGSTILMSKIDAETILQKWRKDVPQQATHT